MWLVEVVDMGVRGMVVGVGVGGWIVVWEVVGIGMRIRINRLMGVLRGVLVYVLVDICWFIISKTLIVCFVILLVVVV